jgi:hypothetical protein
MAASGTHPPYAWAARRDSDRYYAIAFFICMAVIAVAFLYFLRHGYFLIHFPTINFKLPDLHLS